MKLLVIKTLISGVQNDIIREDKSGVSYINENISTELLERK